MIISVMHLSNNHSVQLVCSLTTDVFNMLLYDRDNSINEYLGERLHLIISITVSRRGLVHEYSGDNARMDPFEPRCYPTILLISLGDSDC